MIVRSLRWRLLLGAAVAIFLALLLAWGLMLLLFDRHLERRLAAELEQDAIRIVAGIAVAPDGRLSVNQPPTDARFQTPVSGLYWQASARRNQVRSPSLWDQALAPPPIHSSRDWHVRIGPGPYEPRLIYLERTVIPDRAAGPVLVQVAQDATALATARAEFGRELAMFLAALWLVLSAAAWLQVHLGLRPLGRIREQLGRLQENPSERLIAETVSEVRPLTDAINSLADAREEDLRRARRRAADLAHGLKTPLAAAAAQLRRADGEAASGIEKALDAMKAVVDGELARSRIAAVRHDPSARAEVRAVVEQLVSVLERTEAGERLVLDVDIADELRAPLATEDLTELLGSVADNAVRYAARQVRFVGVEEDEVAVVAVEDDGPGIAPELVADALARGKRLDERGGQGLGLAIAQEIAEATGGTLSLSRASLGGLRVELRWPAARAPAP
ncbi:MAG: sensor histidine kinase [Sphingomonas sp.]|nr:sensor histidine kinase [Sphingomonas sp.]